MPMIISYMHRLLLFFAVALLFTGLPFGCGSGGGAGGATNASKITPIASEGCGDAEIDPGEGCDDGNWENSDGCNGRCGLEVGEAICGNGVKENNECCDDGNLVSGDGCGAGCTLEFSSQAPSVPILATDPADGATWAPTRLYLSWAASTDPDLGDSLVYDVYFVEGNGIPSNAMPYKSAVEETNFIIQASTDNRTKYFPDRVTPIYLEPLQTYTWMICARDNHGATTCSSARTFNTDNSVKGWWRFDEDPAGPNCTGGNGGESVCDYSGNNNHGVPSGNPTWIAAAQDVLGRAFGFDGSNDYVSVQNAASLNPDSLTVMVKIKNSGKPGQQNIIDKRQGGAMGPAGYDLRVSDDAYPLRLSWEVSESNGDEHFVHSIGTILNAIWYHISCSFDLASGDSKNYINGALVNSENFGSLDRSSKSTSTLVFSDTTVFSPPTTTFSYKGNLDEVIIFNRALPTEEVTNNYNSSN